MKKKLYEVLSKGIHKLNREQCSEFFELLVSNLYDVLNEMINKKEYELAVKKLEKDLEELKEEISE